MQVAIPTRTEVPEYQQYRAKVEEAVDALNTEFGHGDWRPLIYRTKPMSRRELVAHYIAADVACVTPLADGMNLVASEYCASRTDGDGALVLSGQAGAATTLGEFAVTVDIRKQESVVTGILQALTMAEAERAQRMARLRSIVTKNTTDLWLRQCVSDIVQPDPVDAEELAAFLKIGHARRGDTGHRVRTGTANAKSPPRRPARTPATDLPAPPAH
jgi:trehalose-6-phosphate synthase